MTVSVQACLLLAKTWGQSYRVHNKLECFFLTDLYSFLCDIKLRYELTSRGSGKTEKDMQLDLKVVASHLVIRNVLSNVL
jgi:hypothetical protein